MSNCSNLTLVCESSPTHSPFDWHAVFLAALLCVVNAVTVLGNTLVITAILTTKNLKSITNLFVMNLAVVDLLVGIFVMPPGVAMLYNGSWPFGSILCDVWISLNVLLCTASILCLCAISVDRYLGVTQPLNYTYKKRTKLMPLLSTVVVWVAAIAITCSQILVWHERKHYENGECRNITNFIFVIVFSCYSFFIPMIIIVFINIKIGCVVAQRHDQLADTDTRSKVFLLDVDVQLRTEYLVYDSKKIAEHYLYSYAFWLDLGALCPFELLQIMVGPQPLLRFPCFLKVYRAIDYYYMVESRTTWPNLWKNTNIINLVFLLVLWFICITRGIFLENSP